LTIAVINRNDPKTNALAFNSDLIDPAHPSQHSRLTQLDVTFSTLVDVAAGAFSILLKTGTPGNVTRTPFAGVVAVNLTVVSGKTKATLSFGGAGVTAGSLNDGDY